MYVEFFRWMKARGHKSPERLPPDIFAIFYESFTAWQREQARAAAAIGDRWVLRAIPPNVVGRPPAA